MKKIGMIILVVALTGFLSGCTATPKKQQQEFKGIFYGYVINSRIGEYRNIFNVTVKIGDQSIENVTISEDQTTQLNLYLGKNMTLVLDKYETYYDYAGGYLNEAKSK
jgi:hypothetical protein